MLKEDPRLKEYVRAKNFFNISAFMWDCSPVPNDEGACRLLRGVSATV